MAERPDLRSAEAREYRHLYRTADWRRLRARRLVCNPLCVMCLPHVTPAIVVDHIKPHKGDRDLFFDFTNTQSLCKMHHNKWKQAAERSRFQRIGVDGWPVEQG